MLIPIIRSFNMSTDIICKAVPADRSIWENTQSRVSMIRCSDEESINTIRSNKMPTHVPLNILKKEFLGSRIEEIKELMKDGTITSILLLGMIIKAVFILLEVKRLLIGHIFRPLKVHWMHLWPYYL